MPTGPSSSLLMIGGSESDDLIHGSYDTILELNATDGSQWKIRQNDDIFFNWIICPVEFIFAKPTLMRFNVFHV